MPTLCPGPDVVLGGEKPQPFGRAAGPWGWGVLLLERKVESTVRANVEGVDFVELSVPGCVVVEGVRF